MWKYPILVKHINRPQRGERECWSIEKNLSEIKLNIYNTNAKNEIPSKNMRKQLREKLNYLVKMANHLINLNL